VCIEDVAGSSGRASSGVGGRAGGKSSPEAETLHWDVQ